MKYDFFIIHASEDKKTIVVPLAEELRKRNYKIWYDDDSLSAGTSQTQTIDNAISKSKAAIVIVSEYFFEKDWPYKEFGAFYSDHKPVIVIRHCISQADIRNKSKLLSDYPSFASEEGIPYLVEKICKTSIEEKNIQKSTVTQAVLVIGSAVSENVLELKKELQIGQKTNVKRARLFGGSGLNYACRLISTNIPVIPLLSIGDDYVGKEILDKVINGTSLKVDSSDELCKIIKNNHFRCAGLHTIQSTIILYNQKRTILSQSPEHIDKFRLFVYDKIDFLEKLPAIQTTIIMIGHIYADNKEFNPDHSGEVTKTIIDTYYKKAIIFTNFGNSQIDKGFIYWKRYLKKTTIFQLSLLEAKKLFRAAGLNDSLLHIIKTFQEHDITAIITLDKFGAVGTYKKGDNGIIFAWPFEIPDFIDPTGAGDAFGAGVISYLYNKQIKGCDIEFGEFWQAIDNARIWAAYACTKMGGANECPSIEELKEYNKKILKTHSGEHSSEVMRFKDSEKILYIMDKAFSQKNK